MKNSYLKDRVFSKDPRFTQKEILRMYIIIGQLYWLLLCLKCSNICWNIKHLVASLGLRDSNQQVVPSFHHWNMLLKVSNSICSKTLYSVAFNCISHKIIKKKMYYGFHEKGIQIIENYHSTGTQQTFTDTGLSTPLNVKCGRPQGSILGPLLVLSASMISEDQLKSNWYCFLMEQQQFWKTEIWVNLWKKSRARKLC